MKFHWFHLMPYQELPADFTQKHRSVWVDVPRSLYDPNKGSRMYHEYLDELEFADQMGYDGVCVNEHHSNAYGLMPSPNLMGSILARSTKNAAVVVLGNSVALYNPPIRVAEEFAMLDVLSQGRLVAGFPVGSSMDTNYAYGVPPADLRARYYEAADLIVKAWTTPEPFAYNGEYTQLRYVNVWPQPIQQPHPPIWVPGGGSVETWDWTTEKDYVYCYLSYYGHKYAKRVMNGFWETVDRLGGHDNPFRAGFAQVIGVAESDEQAEEYYSEAADYLYQRCLHVYPGFAEAPGYRTVRTLKSGMISQFGMTASATRKALSWKEYIDQGYVVAGSPATVRDQLREFIKDCRIGQLMLLMHFGNLSKERTLENTQRFAQEVMPHLRDIWPQYEDKWYPSGAGRHASVPVSAR
ncbi:MAG TPA: LLM class flavin-dependent oxidoreductase [Dehalococcoidia bacterium]|nr:LLM class flavin-dependent oxidoreductase [Dehalococcoidia bacterium]